MENTELILIQEYELGILKEILRIIEKYNLRYYILGGTLLGAVRHQGFIPWDDDIDIGLPRQDYEKFIGFIKEEIKEPFAIHSIQSGIYDFNYYYVRIVDTRLKVLCRRTAKNLILPVWVDVFPLDGVPESKARLNAWVKKGYFLLKLYRRSQYEYYYKKDHTGNWSVKGLLNTAIYYSGIFHVLNREKIWQSLDKHLKLYPYDASSSIINFCGNWGIKELFPKSVYGEGRRYPFEDMMLVGPVDYDCVLTQMYGDYMIPPEEGKRHDHTIEVVRG